MVALGCPAGFSYLWPRIGLSLAVWTIIATLVGAIVSRAPCGELEGALCAFYLRVSGSAAAHVRDGRLAMELVLAGIERASAPRDVWRAASEMRPASMLDVCAAAPDIAEAMVILDGGRFEAYVVMHGGFDSFEVLADMVASCIGCASVAGRGVFVCRRRLRRRIARPFMSQADTTRFARRIRRLSKRCVPRTPLPLSTAYRVRA